MQNRFHGFLLSFENIPAAMMVAESPEDFHIAGPIEKRRRAHSQPKVSPGNCIGLPRERRIKDVDGKKRIQDQETLVVLR
jgi:hypothetical protein